MVTIDSNHGRKIYPNLAGQMTLPELDQLWVADITYVRLAEEFIFLASRPRVVYPEYPYFLTR